MKPRALAPSGVFINRRRPAFLHLSTEVWGTQLLSTRKARDGKTGQAAEGRLRCHHPGWGLQSSWGLSRLYFLLALCFALIGHSFFNLGEL